MIALHLVASFIALFSLSLLAINLATLALPVWVGLSIFFLFEKSGEGLLGAAAVGLTGALAAHLIGVLACAKAQSKMVSLMFCLLYAVPAAVAGYHLGLGLGHLIFSTAIFQKLFSVLLASFTLISSLRRLLPSIFRKEISGRREVSAAPLISRKLDSANAPIGCSHQSRSLFEIMN